MVGSPVEHSLSPVLHRAAYAALGLDGWRYGRDEVARGGLARHVAGLGPEWVGLSVTMPGKEEALELAGSASDEARLAGAANTLVRSPDGWHADNTDVHGLVAALLGAGLGVPGLGGAGPPARAVVVGGGATARSALLALRSLGVARVTLLVRDRPRPQTQELVERLADLRDPAHPALEVEVAPLAHGIPLDRQVAEVVVGTLPASAPAPVLGPVGERSPVLLDVVYAPWPSPLAAAVHRAGAGRVAVVRGTSMLLHQGARQVELMTGRTPPVAAMARALEDHLGSAW